MQTFELKGPDGTTYEVKAPDAKAAVAAFRKMVGASTAATSGQSVPAMPLPENPELQMTGPGPTGGGMGPLYDQGILPRRFVEGEAPAPQMPAELSNALGETMVFDPATGSYTSRELMANRMQPNALDAIMAGAAQGVTFGIGDEVAGVLGGPLLRERGRAALDAARRDRPGTTLAAEIGGSVSVPLPGLGPVNTLKEGVKAGAKAGAVIGGGTAAASADGGALDRIGAGLEGAIAGAIIGAAVPVAVNFGSRAWRSAFGASAQKPTIESLRKAKTAAYNAVDMSGTTFSADEMAALSQRVKDELAQGNYVPGVDRQTDAVVTLLDRRAGEPMKIGQLDKLRQEFYRRAGEAKNEVGIMDAIDAIDEVIASRADTNDLMMAARLANARYKKAELLDLAFQKAQDQTAATGSGGNILNKYRQAVVSIINNPKQAKWFSASEIDAMRAFSQGSASQNVLRLVGKLAPSGNGLMMALNLGAVSANPAMLAVSAGAAGAKALSDRATERQAAGLISRVSGATSAPRAAPGYTTQYNALAGPLAADQTRR